MKNYTAALRLSALQLKVVSHTHDLPVNSRSDTQNIAPAPTEEFTSRIPCLPPTSLALAWTRLPWALGLHAMAAPQSRPPLTIALPLPNLRPHVHKVELPHAEIPLNHLV